MAGIEDILRKILKPKKPKGVVTLMPRKVAAQHVALNTMIKNPNSKSYDSAFGASVIGLDGRYYVIKTFRDDLDNSIQKAANDIIDNNYDLAPKQKKIFQYNLSIRNQLDKELKRLEGVLAKDKIKPDEALKTGKKRWETGETVVPGADVHGIGTLTGDAARLHENAKEMLKMIKELEKEAKELGGTKVDFNKILDDHMRTQKVHAEMMQEGYHRAMVRPFLLDQHSKGLINLDPEIVKSLREGLDVSSGGFMDLDYPDAIDVYKHHFGNTFDQIPAGNMDQSAKGIVKFIEESGNPKVVNKGGFDEAGKYLSRETLEKRMKDAKDRFEWAKNKKEGTIYENITDADAQAYMKESDAEFGKYERFHDQLKIPERSGETVMEGMGTPNSVAKTYDDDGVIFSLTKRTTDADGNMRIIEYNPKTGQATREHMSYATIKDLTKDPKKYELDEIQKMKDELLQKESIQPPFGKEYEKELLDTLEGDQLKQIIKREKVLKEQWTKADQANLVKRKKSSIEQQELRGVEELLAKDIGIYDLSGRLTKQGQDMINNQILEIDDVLNSMDTQFAFVKGETRESLIARLQDKSASLQNTLTKSGVELPADVPTVGGKTLEDTLKGVFEDITPKRTTDIIEGEVKELVNIDEYIDSIKSLDPMDAMKEANKVAGKQGKYASLTDDEVSKILADTEDHIFQRTPHDEFAQGGRVGFAEGNGAIGSAGDYALFQKAIKDGAISPGTSFWYFLELKDAGRLPKIYKAQGGRVGFKTGGIANQNMIATLFNKS